MSYTTQPDAVSPWGTTAPDIGDMYARVQKVFARLEKQPKIEPQRYWEDSMVHGAGREARLRLPGASGSLKSLPRATGPLRLPPMPKGIDVEQVTLVAGAVVGAGALLWWLSKKGLQHPRAQYATLPSWAVT